MVSLMVALMVALMDLEMVVLKVAKTVVLMADE